MAGAVRRYPVSGGGGGCVGFATGTLRSRSRSEKRAGVTQLVFTCFAVAVSPVCTLTYKN